jgi:hypothetical protein
MKLFGYTLRKPWVKYVDLDLGEDLIGNIRKSIASEYVAEIVSLDLCDVECDVISYLEKTVKP